MCSFVFIVLHILLPAYEVFLSPFSLPVCPHADTHIFSSKANFCSSLHPSMSQMKALPRNTSDFNLPGNISQNLLPVQVNSTYYINFDSPLYFYLVLCIMVILNTYLCNNFSNVYCLFYTRTAMRVVTLSILFIIIVPLHAAVPSIWYTFRKYKICFIMKALPKKKGLLTDSVYQRVAHRER